MADSKGASKADHSADLKVDLLDNSRVETKVVPKADHWVDLSAGHWAAHSADLMAGSMAVPRVDWSMVEKMVVYSGGYLVDWKADYWEEMKVEKKADSMAAPKDVHSVVLMVLLSAVLTVVKMAAKKDVC